MTLGEAVTVLGYAIGIFVFALAARRRGLATEGMGWVALWGLAGGILGAKLTQWALDWRLWAGHPSMFLDPRYGGRTILGGILAGWLSVEVAKRRLGIRRSTGDLFALALPAGEAVGRIGCHLNGCCYGIASGAPWAVWQHGAWRQPAQLYSAALDVAILAALWALRGRFAREGSLFRLYLVLYGIGRFGVEFMRERPAVFFGLSLAQWVCLEVAASGLLLLWLGRHGFRTGAVACGCAPEAAGEACHGRQAADL